MEGITLLGIIGAAAGLCISLLVLGGWYGASLLFGFPSPTEDQVKGLMVIAVCTMTSIAWLTAGGMILWDERQASRGRGN